VCCADNSPYLTELTRVLSGTLRNCGTHVAKTTAAFSNAKKRAWEVIMAANQRGGSSEQHAKAGAKGGKASSGGGSSSGSRKEAAKKGGESHSKEQMSEIGKKGGKK
jgi:uncharacterized membrane protein YgcG